MGPPPLELSAIRLSRHDGVRAGGAVRKHTHNFVPPVDLARIGVAPRLQPPRRANRRGGRPRRPPPRPRPTARRCAIPGQPNATRRRPHLEPVAAREPAPECVSLLNRSTPVRTPDPNRPFEPSRDPHSAIRRPEVPRAPIAPAIADSARRSATPCDAVRNGRVLGGRSRLRCRSARFRFHRARCGAVRDRATRCEKKGWRRGRDSNPRWLAPLRFSRPMRGFVSGCGLFGCSGAQKTDSRIDSSRREDVRRASPCESLRRIASCCDEGDGPDAGGKECAERVQTWLARGRGAGGEVRGTMRGQTSRAGSLSGPRPGTPPTRCPAPVPRSNARSSASSRFGSEGGVG
jgi:hypothetical protein